MPRPLPLRPIFFVVKEGLEDPRKVIGRDADAVVLHGENRVGSLRNRHGTVQALFETSLVGRDHHLATVGKSLEAVGDQVHQRFREVVRGPEDRGHARARPDLEPDLGVSRAESLELPALCIVPDDPVEIEALLVGHAASRQGQEILDDRGATLPGALDPDERIPQRALRREVEQKELRVPDDPREEIVQVVGDASRQRPERLHLLSLQELHLEPRVLFLRDPTLRDVRRHVDPHVPVVHPARSPGVMEVPLPQLRVPTLPRDHLGRAPAVTGDQATDRAGGTTGRALEDHRVARLPQPRVRDGVPEAPIHEEELVGLEIRGVDPGIHGVDHGRESIVRPAQALLGPLPHPDFVLELPVGLDEVVRPLPDALLETVPGLPQLRFLLQEGRVRRRQLPVGGGEVLVAPLPEMIEGVRVREHDEVGGDEAQRERRRVVPEEGTPVPQGEDRDGGDQEENGGQRAAPRAEEEGGQQGERVGPEVSRARDTARGEEVQEQRTGEGDPGHRRARVAARPAQVQETRDEEDADQRVEDRQARHPVQPGRHGQGEQIRDAHQDDDVDHHDPSADLEAAALKRRRQEESSQPPRHDVAGTGVRRLRGSRAGFGPSSTRDRIPPTPGVAARPLSLHRSTAIRP
jgi:hypothetical protein